MKKNKVLEQQQLDRMLNRSVKHKIGRFSFKFREPYLSTIDHQSDVSIKMEFDEDKLKENPTQELNRLKQNSCKLLAKYIAVSWLGKPWKIKLFGKIVTSYIYQNLKPSQSISIAMDIILLRDDPAFINSIRLISQLPRESDPKADLVEAQG